MRTLLVAAMLIGGVVPSDLAAQRGGGGGGAHGGGAAHPGFGFGFGSGAGRGGRFFGDRFFGDRFFGGRFGNGFGRGFNNGTGFSGWGSGWGYGRSDWDDSPYFADSGSPPAYGGGNQTSPSTVFLMPPAPPPQPAHPLIREYTWPADAGDARATFSIVPKNGQLRQAVAVWVQDNEVRYTGPDGRTGRMPQATIDCGATDRLNAQKNLRLSLPGCGLSQ
jgi:hypothetical protein